MCLRFESSVKDDEHKAVYNRISLLDDQGREVIRISRMQPIREKNLTDLSSTDEVIVPVSMNMSYYSPIYYNKVTGEPLMKICLPVKDLRSLAVTGVLVAEVNLRTIWQMVRTLNFGKLGEVFVTDLEARVIAHPNRSVVLKGTYFAAPRVPVVMEGLSGIKSVVAGERINFGDQSLVFVTEMPAFEAFRHINVFLLIIGVFFVFLGSLGLGYIVVRQIVRPIESLAATAGRISNGDLTQKAEPRRMDEFGELALAFNTMTAKLVSSIDALEKEKNFVRHIIESLTHPFYVIDVRDYTIKLANSAAEFKDQEGEKKLPRAYASYRYTLQRHGTPMSCS